MMIFLKILAGLSLMGIMVLMSLQVFCRYVLNHSLSWPDEMAGILLAILTFAGAAIGVRHKDHIGFTVILERSSERWRIVLQMFSNLIALSFLGIVLVFSIPLIIRTWGQTPIGVPIPRGLLYLLMWISVAAMSCYTIADMPCLRRLFHRSSSKAPGLSNEID